MVPRDNQTESVRWFRFDSPILSLRSGYALMRYDFCFNNHFFILYNNFDSFFLSSVAFTRRLNFSFDVIHVAKTEIHFAIHGPVELLDERLGEHGGRRNLVTLAPGDCDSRVEVVDL